MRLIDADALLERMEKRIDALRKEYGDYDQYVQGLEAFCQAIDNAPTVERPRGEWADDNVKWKCNRCGKWLIYDGDADMNFCPNCGADMRGEEE